MDRVILETLRPWAIVFHSDITHLKYIRFFLSPRKPKGLSFDFIIKDMIDSIQFFNLIIIQVGKCRKIKPVRKNITIMFSFYKQS